MKIALATWFPRNPEFPRGGVEAVSVNLAGALSRRLGGDVHVVTFDPEIREVVRHEWSGVSVHRLPLSGPSLLGFVTGHGGRMLREYLTRLEPDVVHAHDTFGIMTRGMALPRVFTIHGFIHEDARHSGGWRARIRSELWKHEELATWREQPHVISISPYVRERLRGISSGVIHDIENPIHESCFQVVRHEKHGRLFSAAVISSRKNTLGLAKAVARLPQSTSVTLRLAGPVVEEDYGRRLANFIAECSLPDRIQLLGSLSAAKVREELAAAAVFALVSLEEGAPMGIAEAMAAGVPILASNRCGIPYMVWDGQTGFLVNPEDTDDIADHLSILLSDESLRNRMGLAARAQAFERHHPDLVAEKTLQVYERAIHGVAARSNSHTAFPQAAGEGSGHIGLKPTKA